MRTDPDTVDPLLYRKPEQRTLSLAHRQALRVMRRQQFTRQQKHDALEALGLKPYISAEPSRSHH